MLQGILITGHMACCKEKLNVRITEDKFALLLGSGSHEDINAMIIISWLTAKDMISNLLSFHGIFMLGFLFWWKIILCFMTIPRIMSYFFLVVPTFHCICYSGSLPNAILSLLNYLTSDCFLDQIILCLRTF